VCGDIGSILTHAEARKKNSLHLECFAIEYGVTRKGQIQLERIRHGSKETREEGRQEAREKGR
jgi:hypothetical protein